tara:strand:+ start:117 stop:395 length:279 start_codon:yes stop_codon:yes gene_type:complete
MKQLENNNTAYDVKMGDGSVGVVQCKHGGSTNHAYLWGSLTGNSSEYVLIDSFTTDALKELVLPRYLLISNSPTSASGTVNAATKVYVDETR